ncbi:MAG: hypothetical protein V4662_26765 [Verrucomicrobiota bacterium]
MKIAAVVDGGMLWLSNDGGSTWTASLTAGTRNWKSTAVSTDGRSIVALESNVTERTYFWGDVYYIYDSHVWLSKDGGATWSRKNTEAIGRSKITLSPGGRKIAVAGVGGVWISADEGATWTKRVIPLEGILAAGKVASFTIITIGTPVQTWSDVTYSNDGSRLWVVGAAHGSMAGHNLWVTDDDGATWSERPNPSFVFYGDMAVSADGSQVLMMPGYLRRDLWETADGGLTWSQADIDSVPAWNVTAMSADGSVRVAGSEKGGLWVSTDGGSSWVRRQADLRHNWISVCCSDDGHEMAAAVANGSLWTSADSGTTWTRHEQAGEDFVYGWNTLAMSEDGSRLVVGEGGGSLWALDHAGQHWEELLEAGQRFWRGIADSHDGTRLVTASQEIDSNRMLSPGSLRLSPDRGLHWSSLDSAGQKHWILITSSADGQRLAAGIDAGFLHTSENGGVTWTARPEPGALKWTSMAASRDGQRLVVADATLPGKFSYEKLGSLRISHDGGATWKELTAAGKRHWKAVTSSHDGHFLAAAVNDAGIYTSEDFGATWTLRAGPGNRSWSDMDCSADGKYLAAVSGWHGIWTSADHGRTWQMSAGTEQPRWSGVQVSADGSRYAAVAGTGGLWVNDLSVKSEPAGSNLTAPFSGPNAVYQWFKDGVAVRGATGISYHPPSGLSGAGVYHVKVTLTGSDKPFFTETSMPFRVETEDPGLLVYKLTATATVHEGASKINAAVTGYLVVDRPRQRGGLIWQRSYGRQKAHAKEVLEDLRTRSTGPAAKSQTVITDLQSTGTSDAPGDDAVLWLNGTESLVILRPAGPAGPLLQTIAPATLTGHSNLVIKTSSTTTTWRIETSAVKGVLDTPATMWSRVISLDETVEQALQRLTGQLSTAGSLLME